MRETSKLPTASLRAPNRHLSFHSQSPRAPRDDAKLAVSKILQNATESDEPLRKLVRARARGNGRSASFLSAWIVPYRHSREGRNLLSTWIVPYRHSREGRNLLSTWIVPYRHSREGRNLLSTWIVPYRHSREGRNLLSTWIVPYRHSREGGNLPSAWIAPCRHSREGRNLLSTWIAPCRHSREGGNPLSVIWIAPRAQRILGVAVLYPPMPINQTEPSYILCC